MPTAATVSNDPLSTQGQKLAQRLKPRHLTLLRQIQIHGSLTQVATHAGISQPAITKALAELEDICGGQLFVRSGRGLTPTALGELALGKAHHMLREIDNWASEMQAVRQGRSGRLNIGAVPYVSGVLLTEAVTRLHDEHNAIVSIRHATSDVLIQALKNRELDCILGRAPGIAGNPDLWHQVLYTQKPVLIGHESLARRLARHNPDWKALAQLKWILPAPTTPVTMRMAEVFTHAETATPVPIIETYSLDVMHGMLSRHDGMVAVVPEDIAHEMMKRGGIGIVPSRMSWELPPISLIRRVRDVPMDVEEHFARIVRELCVGRGLGSF